jgi:hypothetical protein
MIIFVRFIFSESQKTLQPPRNPNAPHTTIPGRRTNHRCRSRRSRTAQPHAVPITPPRRLNPRITSHPNRRRRFPHPTATAPSLENPYLTL